MKNVFLLIIFGSLVFSLACSKPVKESIAGSSGTDTMAEIRDTVLGSAAEVEEEFLAGEGPEIPTGNFFDPEQEGKSTLIEDMPDSLYPRPQVQSNEFVALDEDPYTGNSWDELIATITTNKGEIKISFYHDDAPRHVENFVYLVRHGFFNGLTFHRYEEGFVIQGGDPEGTGEGGPGYNITAEIIVKHLKGAVAAARRPNSVNPLMMSSGSQYYICLEDLDQLDEGGYSVWGMVEAGLDVVMELRVGDIMEKIEIS